MTERQAIRIPHLEVGHWAALLVRRGSRRPFSRYHIDHLPQAARPSSRYRSQAVFEHLDDYAVDSNLSRRNAMTRKWRSASLNLSEPNGWKALSCGRGLLIRSYCSEAAPIHRLANDLARSTISAALRSEAFFRIRFLPMTSVLRIGGIRRTSSCLPWPVSETHSRFCAPPRRRSRVLHDKTSHSKPTIILLVYIWKHDDRLTQKPPHVVNDQLAVVSDGRTVWH